MKLCKSVVSENDMETDNDNTGTVYSLALVETESVHTAHEKDMAQFRDMLQQEDSPHATATTLALEPALHQHSIISSEEFGNARLTAHASQEARLSGRVVAAPPPAAAATMPSSRMPSKPARKATTAANFFASKASSTKRKDTKSKKDTATKNKETAAAKKPPAQKKSDGKKRATSKTKDEPEAMDIDSADFVQEEKENSINTKVGNADDFVGDEDEDDDFMEQEVERKRRNAAREKSRSSKKKQEKPVEQEDEVEVVKVHGAMDAFAQPSEKKPEHKKKRRKRLEEKTTMDANGYIHTETQAVWEDVEEEDEPVPVAKTAPVKKAPVKNTKNMKQGSLMGFFKKK